LSVSDNAFLAKYFSNLSNSSLVNQYLTFLGKKIATLIPKTE
jgi:hypothetical protein